MTHANSITGANDVRKDADLDGTVDSNDVAHANSIAGGYQTLGFGVLSSAAIGATRGYAGYQALPELARTMWHVRHRVLDSELGRWTRRDPLGYVDGLGLYEYVGGMTLRSRDSSGLLRQPWDLDRLTRTCFSPLGDRLLQIRCCAVLASSLQECQYCCRLLWANDTESEIECRAKCQDRWKPQSPKPTYPAPQPHPLPVRPISDPFKDFDFRCISLCAEEIARWASHGKCNDYCTGMDLFECARAAQRLAAQCAERCRNGKDLRTWFDGEMERWARANCGGRGEH